MLERHTFPTGEKVWLPRCRMLVQRFLLCWWLLQPQAPTVSSFGSSPSQQLPTLPVSDFVTECTNSCSPCDISTVHLQQWPRQPASSLRAACVVLLLQCLLWGSSLWTVFPGSLEGGLPASSAHMTLHGLLRYPWARAVTPPSKIWVWAWCFSFGCCISAPQAPTYPYAAVFYRVLSNSYYPISLHSQLLL